MPYIISNRTSDKKKNVIYYNPVRLFFFYVGSFVVLGAICLAGFVTLNNYRNLQNLAEAGLTTQGQLISHHIATGPKSKSYYITYSYTISTSNSLPQTYETKRQVQVNEETYYRLAIGAQVPVRYLPAQPSIARLLEVKEDNFGMDTGLWILLALTVAELYLIDQIITGHRVRAKYRLDQICQN